MSLYDDPTMTPMPAGDDDMKPADDMDDLKEEGQSTEEVAEKEEGAETTDEGTN